MNTTYTDRAALKDAMRIYRQARGTHEALANVRKEAAKVIDGLLPLIPNSDAVMDEIDIELDAEDAA
jgi:hypothetical protein